MDAVERLSLEAATGNSLSAVEHIHRYRIAAEIFAGSRVLDLCCGSGYGSRILRQTCPSVVGIDIDVGTIDMARVTIGRESQVEFEVGDATEVLGGKLTDRFDAVVLFEGLEHLADPEEALALVERHARRGMLFLVSVPNSKTFDEENPFHVTDYEYEDAVGIAQRFSNATLLFQYVAEGSLIRTRSDGGLTTELVELERAEPEYANNFVICVNCEPSVADAQRLHLIATTAHNRYMRSLEIANRELRRANARLARKRLGVADSAAASLLAKVDRLTKELEILRVERAAEATQRDEQQAHDEWIADLHRQIEFHRERANAIEMSRPWRAWMRFYRLRLAIRRTLRGH